MDGKRGLDDSKGVGNSVTQDGELGSASADQISILQESGSMIEVDTKVENASMVVASTRMDNVHSDISGVSTLDNHQTDKSPLKRARITSIDKQPSVHVVYSSLPRESKLKLKELLQQWSEWQAQQEPYGKASSNDTLECGEETYFPALHVGPEKSSIMAFWLESQVKQEEDSKYTPVDCDSVPLYDRGFVLGSSTLGGSYESERFERLEASRCFNCGSYSHSLKQCTRPRDNIAISNARKQHSAKKNTAATGRGQARYYQNSPGKFDDLKAGFLGSETRECLGIGELDPPPWLHRMREIGYPPGYLDDVTEEDPPSGITIYANEENQVEFEEGELPEKGEAVPPEKKMTVRFPGINAPIPANADERQWMSSHTSGSGPRRNISQHSSGRCESFGGYDHDNKRPRDCRQGAPDVNDIGQIYPRHGYSSRNSPCDRNRPSAVSPNLGRSFSERGWRGIFSHEGAPGHGPHGLLSPQYSLNVLRPSLLQHSSTASFERRVPEVPYLPSPDAWSHGRDKDRHRDRSDYRHHPRR